MTLDQPFLMPPALQDWLPDAHLARFIADVAETLDRSEIYSAYQRNDGRGLAAYHPLMLTRLLLYGYATGTRRSCWRRRSPKRSTTGSNYCRWRLRPTRRWTSRRNSYWPTRKTIVEPVIGHIKHQRGFRQFALRGLNKVQAEWKLICLTHNLLKLHRLTLAA